MGFYEKREIFQRGYDTAAKEETKIICLCKREITLDKIELKYTVRTGTLEFGVPCECGEFYYFKIERSEK